MRRRLARMAFDVHDGPMQELIALSYGLQALQKMVAEELDRDRVHSEFEHLGARLVETEQMLRSMMFALEQTSAEPTDQSIIVERQVAAFRDRCPNVAVEVAVSGNVDLQTDSQRIALDRVLRESLSNIAKHGFDFAALHEAFFDRSVFYPAKLGRFRAIGSLGDRMVTVIFSPLGAEAISVVSMRPASVTERRLHDEAI